MAYEEYLDLIENVKNDGSFYVLYALDGVHNQRSGKNGIEFINKSQELLLEMKNEFLELEQLIGKKILVRDEIIKISNSKKDLTNFNGKFSCYHNPNFTSGDLLSFYFYSENISVEMFKKVFKKCAKKIDNKFKYHVAKIGYQTNDYIKAKNLLWVGYAQQYLNQNKNERICNISLIDKGIEK